MPSDWYSRQKERKNSIATVRDIQDEYDLTSVEAKLLMGQLVARFLAYQVKMDGVQGWIIDKRGVELMDEQHKEMRKWRGRKWVVWV